MKSPRANLFLDNDAQGSIHIHRQVRRMDLIFDRKTPRASCRIEGDVRDVQGDLITVLGPLEVHANVIAVGSLDLRPLTFDGPAGILIWPEPGR